MTARPFTSEIEAVVGTRHISGAECESQASARDRTVDDFQYWWNGGVSRSLYSLSTAPAMGFASGARLGPFEILAPLGAGGWVRSIVHAIRDSIGPSPSR